MLQIHPLALLESGGKTGTTSSPQVTKHLSKRSAQLRHDTLALEQLQRLADLGERGKTSTNDHGPACVIS